MLKAFDCYLEGHAHLRVFGEDVAAAKDEYARLYDLPSVEMASYDFKAVEVDPGTAPPVEGPGWFHRRELAGTIGTERKLTDEAKVTEAPRAPEAKPVEAKPAAAATPAPADSKPAAAATAPAATATK